LKNLLTVYGALEELSERDHNFLGRMMHLEKASNGNSTMDLLASFTRRKGMFRGGKLEQGAKQRRGEDPGQRSFSGIWQRGIHSRGRAAFGTVPSLS
jgi:hypothetical protein